MASKSENRRLIDGAMSRQDFTTTNSSVGTGSQLSDFSRQVGWRKPDNDDDDGQSTC